MTGPRITGVQIRDIRVSAKTIWRHLQVNCDDGRTGLGEFSYDRQPDDIDTMARDAGAFLTGQPATVAALAPVAGMLTKSFAAATIYSALEAALCDLQAQQSDVPLHRFLGSTGTQAAVPLYANINRRVAPRTPEGFADSVTHARLAGFDAFKIAPFDGLTPDLCPTSEGRALMAAGLARIAAAVDAADGKLAPMIDCHWRFDPASALAILPALQDLGVTWFECPIPETTAQIDTLKQLRGAANAQGMRLAGLETMTNWSSFNPFVSAGAYDVIMPDVKHAGGLQISVEIARKAMAAGTAIALHNPTGPVGHLGSLHVMLAAGSTERMEIQYDESPLFWTTTNPGVRVQNAQAIAPGGVGLGAGLVD